jgi:hypothetical protein
MRSSLLILILGLVFAACAGRNVRPMGLASSRDELAHRRTQQIQRLHDYRIAAVFPTDNSGNLISVFRDQRGRPCPMAALIEQSGDRALVDRVVVQNNGLRLVNVHDGPLMDWMVSSGLTQQEVELVQGVFEVYRWGKEERMTARRRVVRRLEEIELRLVAETSRSLNIAAARLPRVGQDAVAQSH